jgi:Fe-S-cluster containining protein
MTLYYGTMSGNVFVIPTLYNKENPRHLIRLAPLAERAFSFGKNRRMRSIVGGIFAKPMSQEFCCARCAKTGKTCCQETEIYVTLNNIRRIAVFTSRLDFFEYRSPADPTYLGNDDDPQWQQYVFRLDGTRRVLKQLASGNCIFLAAAGCQLSNDVRPLICRLYPLTYTKAGINAEPDERCPVKMLSQGRSVMETFGISPQQALDWHEDLYREMIHQQGGDTDEDWTDLRPAI